MSGLLPLHDYIFESGRGNIIQLFTQQIAKLRVITGKFCGTECITDKTERTGNEEDSDPQLDSDCSAVVDGQHLDP